MHARLKNTLGPGTNLIIHCQSKDDNLGVHVLSNDEAFEWSFRPNFWSTTTLFFCKVQWEEKVMSFDSYREDNDFYLREHLFWDINSRGACLLNIDKGNYEFCFEWPKVKILGMDQKFGNDMP